MTAPELQREAPGSLNAADPVRMAKPRLKDNTAIAIPQPEPDSGTDAARPDWMNEAAEVARQMARAVPRAKGSGDVPLEEAPAGKAPEGVFNRGPAHRAGDIEMIGPGIERRWVSGRCYWEFGRPPDLLWSPGPRINPLRCMAGSGSADGDLFEHLKPKYLQPTP